MYDDETKLSGKSKSHQDNLISHHYYMENSSGYGLLTDWSIVTSPSSRFENKTNTQSAMDTLQWNSDRP